MAGIKDSPQANVVHLPHFLLVVLFTLFIGQSTHSRLKEEREKDKRTERLGKRVRRGWDIEKEKVNGKHCVVFLLIIFTSIFFFVVKSVVAYKETLFRKCFSGKSKIEGYVLKETLYNYHITFFLSATVNILNLPDVRNV